MWPRLTDQLQHANQDTSRHSSKSTYAFGFASEITFLNMLTFFTSCQAYWECIKPFWKPRYAEVAPQDVLALGNVMNAFETSFGGIKITLLLDDMEDLSRFGGPSLDEVILLRYERTSEGMSQIRSGSTLIPSRSRAYEVLRTHAGELEGVDIGNTPPHARTNTAPPYAAVAKPMPRN